MDLITSHIAIASGRLDRHKGMINTAFESSATSAQDLLQGERIDVLFIDSPDAVIPELGVAGYTYGPHVVIVAIDPESLNLTQLGLTSTLVHELHHAMRWRGPGCGGNLGAMLVSEGLAQLFEEEVLGAPPMYSQVPITQLEVEQAKREVYQRPFSQAKWFYGADGITRHFGYTYGYQICKTYSASMGKSASELVDVPTREVLEVAGIN